MSTFSIVSLVRLDYCVFCAYKVCPQNKGWRGRDMRSQNGFLLAFRGRFLNLDNHSFQQQCSRDELSFSTSSPTPVGIIINLSDVPYTRTKAPYSLHMHVPMHVTVLYMCLPTTCRVLYNTAHLGNKAIPMTRATARHSDSRSLKYLESHDTRGRLLAFVPPRSVRGRGRGSGPSREFCSAARPYGSIIEKQGCGRPKAICEQGCRLLEEAF
ncbi:hypothetical protein M432DRAFT_590500 [Thermoascus aurantiacus ATCC 26904]